MTAKVDETIIYFLPGEFTRAGSKKLVGCDRGLIIQKTNVRDIDS